MRLIAILPMLAIFIAVASAEQPEPGKWQATADVGLNVNQSTYSNSWVGGEEGSLSWTLVSNLLAERQFTRSLNWRNTLKLTFGQIHREVRDEVDRKEKSWASPEKSSDRIFFESLMRLTLGYLVDPYASFTFESQFYDASHPVVGRFLNPIMLTESAGVGRTLAKNERLELYSRLGAAIREKLDRQVTPAALDLDESEYDTDMESSTDGGLEWVTDFKRTFNPSLSYVSKLRVFQAFFSSASDDFEGLPNEDYWKTADVAWENTFAAAVAKYVQVSLFFELLYDKEVELRGRFREILALGVTYKLL